MTTCYECPRNCGADRTSGLGFCGCGKEIEICRASKHFWEEPCVSGENGSGTVFFCGCNLGCVFCQNHQISRKLTGKTSPVHCFSQTDFCELLLFLQQTGVENINLVTPTHFTEEIAKALKTVRPKLSIPVIWNSSGYEKPETLKKLDGLVDVFLPDLKFFSKKNAAAFSSAPDYFSVAVKAIAEMHRQQPKTVLENGRIKQGVLIRHLVLPGMTVESIKILHCIAEKFPQTPVSVMCQYYPAGRAKEFPPLDRKLKYLEYSLVKKQAKKLGLTGYFQEMDSATSVYTPDFSDSGLLDLFFSPR